MPGLQQLQQHPASSGRFLAALLCRLFPTPQREAGKESVGEGRQKSPPPTPESLGIGKSASAKQAHKNPPVKISALEGEEERGPLVILKRLACAAAEMSASREFRLGLNVSPTRKEMATPAISASSRPRGEELV